MKIALLIAVAILVAGVLYLCTQEPKFRGSNCGFSFMLLKGGYRALTVEFCDAMQPQPSGKMRPVLIDEKNNSMKHGLYWIPKVRWVDTRGLEERLTQQGLLPKQP